MDERSDLESTGRTGTLHGDRPTRSVEQGRSVRRRGWSRGDRKRLVIWFLVGSVAPGPIAFLLDRATHHNSPTFTALSEFLIKVVLSLFVVLATWIVARMEKRPLDDYGIPPRQAFRSRFWEGAMWGFAMLSAVIFVLYLLGNVRIEPPVLTRAAAFQYAAGWAGAFLAVAINEEFAFRGYWLFFMSKGLGFWPGALFLSSIFLLAHIFNPGENALGLSQIFAIGLLFCLTVRRTGNLWFAVGFHAAWDWAQTFFYGTPNSGRVGEGRLLDAVTRGPSWLTGGSAGPEGSVIALVVLVLCALLVHLRFPKAIYPPDPDAGNLSADSRG